ncbi:MAG: toxic anion resistance protein [Candidatus Heimdallarchaeota archaeon]
METQIQKTKFHEGNVEFKEKPENLSLNRLPAENLLAEELGLPAVRKDKDIDPALNEHTDKVLNLLLGKGKEVDDFTKKRYVNEMGMIYQTALSGHSKILDQSIRTLGNTQDGGPVATSLLDLRNQVEELNPRHFDLTNPTGTIAKFFRKILGKSNPFSKYLEKYESAQNVIETIMADLTAGRDSLIDDNQTLEIDKKVMRDTLIGLTKAIEMGNLLYKKLEITLKTDYKETFLDYKFIQEELLFPLNQRIIDLQTTLAVNQQGVLSYDILIRNHNELINGVNRTINITTSALRIAVTTRLALNKQRQVLEAKNKIDQTTSDLIEDNANVLQTQGVEIQKMASESTLNIEQLTNAFDSLNQAMDEIATYRRESLPGMRDAVNKFQKLTDAAQETIIKMEKGTALKENVILDVTDFEVLN